MLTSSVRGTVDKTETRLKSRTIQPDFTKPGKTSPEPDAPAVSESSKLASAPSPRPLLPSLPRMMAVTATTTTIAMHSTSSSIHLPSESSTSATLRSLYPRATKSFVQRDFTLTQTLLNSAFELLAPPSGLEDSYAQQRRKWDILRITLETTAYASPPESTADLPPALRANTLETPQGLISRMHARSLRLFTPTAYTPSPGFLPAQILVTLVLSSLKHECPQVARALIEQWLGHRRPRDEEAIEPGDAEGYEKVLDIYCIHVLPRLEEWDYAKEFLSYERELSTEKRQVREMQVRVHSLILTISCRTCVRLLKPLKIKPWLTVKL